MTAAEVCALAAMFDGYHVKKSEVKGMSQRGGSVESFVRFGDSVLSPLPFTGSADAIICLHKSEYSRMKDELKPGGIDLSAYLEKGHAAVKGKAMFLNTYMLGALSSFLEIKESSWLEAIKAKLKKDTEENKRIFLLGRGEAER